MAIVAGLDVHGAQITLDALDRSMGGVRRGRIARGPGPSRRGRAGSSAASCVSWSRRARAGCSSMRRWPPRGRWGIWPGRSRRTRWGVRSGAPRPIGPTRCGCGRCFARAGGRRPGSRPRTCAGGAPGRGWASRRSTSARPGCGESQQRSSTAASRASLGDAARLRPPAGRSAAPASTSACTAPTAARGPAS